MHCERYRRRGRDTVADIPHVFKILSRLDDGDIRVDVGELYEAGEVLGRGCWRVKVCGVDVDEVCASVGIRACNSDATCLGIGRARRRLCWCTRCRALITAFLFVFLRLKIRLAFRSIRKTWNLKCCIISR